MVSPVFAQIEELHGLPEAIFCMADNDNLKKAGDHELDPGWTNYRKLIQYVTFDVTDCLQRGRNVLGAEAGSGWFIKADEHYTFAFPPFMPPIRIRISHTVRAWCRRWSWS